MNALIDSTSAQYSIKQNRIYSMGFSMGGFMTQRLACELSSRIAAIASMAGTIGTEISSTCNPTRPVPVAHFHGTADQTISYTANSYGMSVGPLINFWTNHNNTDATPIHAMLPDLVADGYTVEHDLYENGDQNSVVELFKVNNAGHSWLYPPANDISYSIEAWKFFSRFELNSSVGIKEIKNETMLSYPNPAQNSITIKVPNSNSKNNVKLFTFTGQEVLNLQLNEVEKTISLEGMQLSNGIYLLQVDTDGKRYTEKIILEN
jgi:polyhydroxybutyrate depolymerase